MCAESEIRPNELLINPYINSTTMNAKLANKKKNKYLESLLAMMNCKYMTMPFMTFDFDVLLFVCPNENGNVVLIMFGWPVNVVTDLINSIPASMNVVG